MATPQHGLQPMIGYLMYLLGREGMTEERALEMANREAQERGWPRSLLGESLQWAISNRAATDRVARGDYQTPIGNVLNIPTTSGELVGFRVIVGLELGANAPAGTRPTASVVVNMPVGATAENAANAAIALWNSQQTNPKNGSDRFSTAVSASVAAVFEGGLEGGIVVQLGIK